MHYHRCLGKLLRQSSCLQLSNTVYKFCCLVESAKVCGVKGIPLKVASQTRRLCSFSLFSALTAGRPCSVARASTFLYASQNNL